MHLRPDLLRNIENEMQSVPGEGDGETAEMTATNGSVADPLDDVFGSASEGVGHGSHYYSGTDDTTTTPLAPLPTLDELERRHHHPSDMHRLRSEHATAGYRDGVTAAKAASAQPGFDEGFGLGASLGKRAGELLGVVEGLVAAVGGASSSSSASSPSAGVGSEKPYEGGRRSAYGGKEAGGGTSIGEGEKARLRALLAGIREELSFRSVFSPEFWAPDGTWTYAVLPSGGGGDGEVLFKDVVEMHPLIAKWRAVVEAEMARWRIDRGVFGDREGDEAGVEAGEGEDGSRSTMAARAPVKKGQATTTASSGARDALQW